MKETFLLSGVLLLVDWILWNQSI